MTPVVRPFRRSDRDQLTALVNAHLAAVVPGLSVSVSALLSHLEAEPGEFIVDRWVAERRTLVAEQRRRIVAAAHLLRYDDADEVGGDYRGAGEIRWLVFWPPDPSWPDSHLGGREVLRGSLAQLEAWRVRQVLADGSLPGPGVYGVPEQWPHVREAYATAGFRAGREESVLLASVPELLDRPAPARPDLSCGRTLGINGTRFSALAHGDAVGYLEVDTNLGEGGRFARGVGWADIGNVHVAPEHRRQGVATWLLAQAAEWLQLGGVSRLLSYLGPDDTAAESAWLYSAGFRPLTTTVRGLQRP